MKIKKFIGNYILINIELTYKLVKKEHKERIKRRKSKYDLIRLERSTKFYIIVM